MLAGALRQSTESRSWPKLGGDIAPHGIFVARKSSFEVTVRKLALGPDALALIFAALPLEEQGWTFETTRITRAGTSADQWPIWRVERTISNPHR